MDGSKGTSRPPPGLARSLQATPREPKSTPDAPAQVSARKGVGAGSLPQRGQPRERRFLFYSHDGLGLGHARRNLAIADALGDLAADASVLVASGTEELETLGIPPGVDILKLPGLRKLGNERYAARRLRVSPTDFRTVRARLLAAAVESFRPEVLLSDKHPLGPGGELQPALEVARLAGVRTVLGLRDILDHPQTVAREWAAHGLFEQITRYYDRVLIYGQPDILDPVREYGFPSSVADMAHFCGYVFRPAARTRWQDDSIVTHHRSSRTRPLVLATAGGGEDGFALLRTFIEAVAGRPWDAIVVSGPQGDPGETERLRGLGAEAGVRFQRFVPGLSSSFGSLDALVCMGGYNTLIEAAATGVPTVCVPRVRPRVEQLLRAREFARLGLLTLLEPGRVDATHLGAAIRQAVEKRSVPGVREGRTQLDLDGARRAAHHLLELAADAPAGAVRRAAAP
jgi:predicted glycosyltransferase